MIEAFLPSAFLLQPSNSARYANWQSDEVQTFVMLFVGSTPTRATC